jgi:hypothetical protein
MTEIPAWIFTAANLSIAVVFAVVLLNLYSRQSAAIIALATSWTARLAELVEKSTSALVGVQAAVITLQTLVATLCEEVRDRRGRRDG